MQNSLFTSLLVGLLFVCGCASPGGSGSEALDATGSEISGAPGTTTMDATSESDTGTTTTPGVTTSNAESAAGGSATSEATPAERAGDQVGGETPAAETVPDGAKPVNASATETQSVSTIPRGRPALLTPALATATAPETYKIRFTTTKGDFIVAVRREWAPHGADRLYNLVKIGFFSDVAFFRVIKNFVVQFGIPGDPEVSAVWAEAPIQDDDVRQSNTRGFISFADRRIPNSRTTQLFINLATMNSYLDDDGYAPVGQVIEGMDVVDSLYSGYGDVAPRGPGPSQTKIQSHGNEYLRREFPELDYIRSASIVE